MIDGSNETCWNSESGDSQWILLTFDEEVCPQSINITFQGGFVGREMLVFDAAGVEISRYFPQDTNRPQEFLLTQQHPTTSLRIVFNKSTDFYGRVTIYNLEIFE
jgi:hypothetical protein